MATQAQMLITVRSLVRKLNKVKPEWADEIIADKLNLVDCNHCVLGYVYARDAAASMSSTGYGYAVWGIPTPFSDGKLSRAQDSALASNEYLLAWRLVIAERRLACQPKS